MRKHNGKYGYLQMEPFQGNVSAQHFVGNLKPASKAMSNGDGSDSPLTGFRPAASPYISDADRRARKNRARARNVSANAVKKEGEE